MNGERVMIATPSQAASNFIDEFLWKQPKEGFLPHLCPTAPCDDPIIISNKSTNLNKAQVLINLCSGVSPIADQFTVVYELWDETDADKKLLSEKKFNAYRNSGNELEAI